MIIRHIADLDHSRIVRSDTWQSTRLILTDDKMGFSFNITVMYAETETRMCYKNHLESCYCLDGEAEVVDLATGGVHHLRPGGIYIQDKHDEHIVRPKTDLTIACVFNPALIGSEKHLPDGSYVAQNAASTLQSSR